MAIATKIRGHRNQSGTNDPKPVKEPRKVTSNDNTSRQASTTEEASCQDALNDIRSRQASATEEASCQDSLNDIKGGQPSATNEASREAAPDDN
jgi:hypothetical protein